MDNRELGYLRRQRIEGKITVKELKDRVIASCQKMPVVDVHTACGSELALIKDKGLRDYMYILLKRIPRYFWHVPASVIGFHETYTDNLMGGLLVHSRKVARVAQKIGDPYGIAYLSDDFVVAGLLHDGLKYGLNGIVPKGDDHATFAASWLEENSIFDDRPQIRDMIRTHLGRWGLSKPNTDAEMAFHLADFVVSRGASPALDGATSKSGMKFSSKNTSGARSRTSSSSKSKGKYGRRRY
ncbi:MAG: hypothetical protein JKX97_01025 [Candidatus Lindowbacteria bacterium]|nr:hypothetical protein [Candidatus Lindowbacteria bacterium]